MAVERLQGPVYLDTSALVKLYLPEPQSDEINHVFSGRRDLMVSELTITEVVSAVARRQRESEMDDQAGRHLYRRLLDDREVGYYQRLALSPSTHREAERLLLSLREISLRAADALHLALALEAGSRTLATFDRRMRLAADSYGLSVFPQELGPAGSF